MMVISPLEQFTIIHIIPFSIGNFFFSFTNSSLFLLLSTGLIITWLWMTTTRGGYLVPNRWQSIMEMLYEFVLGLVDSQIVGSRGLSFFPLIFVVFTFLLMANLIGMIPYSFTVTSHFVVTSGLAFSLFVGITLVGLSTHGLHFFSFFLPKGVPLPLAPLIVVLELISYSFRGLSLGIRLFANMMAGHTLVKILSGFAWTMLSIGGFLYIAQLAPVMIVFALTGLEIGVAMLQAYVFTILLCIYLNDAINLH